MLPRDIDVWQGLRTIHLGTGIGLQFLSVAFTCVMPIVILPKLESFFPSIKWVIMRFIYM